MCAFAASTFWNNSSTLLAVKGTGTLGSIIAVDSLLSYTQGHVSLFQTVHALEMSS